MSDFVEYSSKSLPANGLKIIHDINKSLGIQRPEMDFIILTDSPDFDKEIVKNNKLYLVVNKAFKNTNPYFSLVRDLNSAGFNLAYKATTDAGQLEAITASFTAKSEGDKTAKETDSKEHKKLSSFFDGILREAFDDKVSDIHIEKRKTEAVIKMRKNGELGTTNEGQSCQFIENLCRVIYNIFAEKEGKDVNFSVEEFQQAAINTTIKDEEVKLRYQSLPTYPDGFDVVLRLLPLGKDDEKIIPLTKLGFEPSQEKTIKSIIAKPIGALVIAGTTGSGKSTTLKNLLMSVNLARDYKSKIYTIEDPPEYKIPFVSQIPVTRRKGQETINPFEAPLIATMRGDPDILMIGEIRDTLTGDGLKKATQSGHQVMTTVHAASSLGIVERLSDFNISPNIMASPEFLTGLLYQKLLPVLCPVCSKEFSELIESAGVTEEVIELQKRLEDVFEDVSQDKLSIKIRNQNGCDKCKHTGISGRTICAEIISPDFEMLNYFKNQDAAGALKYWLSTSDENILSNEMRGKSAQEHAILKMSKGIISPFDLETAFGPVNHTKLKRIQLEEQNYNNSSIEELNRLFGITDEIKNRTKSKMANKGSKQETDENSTKGVDLLGGLRHKLQ